MGASECERDHYRLYLFDKVTLWLFFFQRTNSYDRSFQIEFPDLKILIKNLDAHVLARYLVMT